jgi:signal transduction histidine kinase
VRHLVRDRTDQLQRSLSVQATLYEQTRHQLDQLRQLNQQKDEFLSAVSHELRTPLTSMTLAIRMLRQGNLPPERQQQYFDILEQQCHQESKLVRDLLKLQELETQAPDLQPETFSLAPLLEGLRTQFEVTWAHKNLNLQLDFPSGDVRLYSDTDSLHRIFEELLTNAGKYAFPGTTVRCQVSRSFDCPSGRITIALYNIGETIAAQDMPYIFEKFYRGQDVTQQAIAGTGLGLALVKNLVQLLEGSVEASSHPRQGAKGSDTCFRIVLPQRLACAEVS